jgi:bacterioferritin-associated ferredoxin
LALLQDRGLPHDAARASTLEHELQRIDRFRDVLEAAFPFPAHWADDIADDTLLCRCEEVTAGEARQAIGNFSLCEVNRLKAVSRVGMGRCQGRVCGAAASELMMREAGRDIASVGRLRAQPPIKPIPFSSSMSEPTSEEQHEPAR